MPQHEDILKILIEKLQGIKFALIGSMGLKFQGVEIDVRDIDLLVDNEGIRKISQIFNSELIKNADKGYLETKFYINDVEVHCVSNILNPLRPNDILARSVLIEKNGIKIFCMPLKTELEFYKYLNREKDQKTIKSIEEKLNEK
jgi:predicted nucleotidyltransferase